MDSATPVKLVNLIIPKRDRHQSLLVCLHYLNLACNDKRFKVTVYIVDDSVKFSTIGNYENFNLVPLPYPNQSMFNKSRLINYALSHMGDCDWFSIIDVDMIYSDNFLDCINKKIELGCEYIVSHGYKLKKNISEYIISNKPSIEYFRGSAEKEEFRVGPSQITLTKTAYSKLLSVFGTPLYDEFYEGWGAEDSDISIKSMFLQNKHKLNKDQIYDIWYHLYHESRNIDSAQYQKNYNHFRDHIKINGIMAAQRLGG